MEFCPDIFIVKPQLLHHVLSILKGFFFPQNKICGSKWKGCRKALCSSTELADGGWEVWVICIVLAPIY